MTAQEALARLLDGHDLTREEARDVMGSVMRGEATEAQIGGLLDRAAPEGRDGRRDRRLAPRRCASTCSACTRSATTSWTPPGRAETGSGRSTSPRRPRWSPRQRGRASRSTATAPCRPSPGSADVLEALGFTLELPPARDRGLDRPARVRLPLRPHASPGHAPCRAGAPAARRADGLQRARPARRTRRAPARRWSACTRPTSCRRSRTCSRAWARAGRSSCTARAASTSSPPPGPNLVCEVVDGEVHRREIDPLDFGVPRCDPNDLAGRLARRQRGDDSRDLRRRARPEARGGAPERGRGDRRGGTRGGSRRGLRRSPGDAVDEGAAAVRLEALIRFSRSAAPPEPEAA